MTGVNLIEGFMIGGSPGVVERWCELVFEGCSSIWTMLFEKILGFLLPILDQVYCPLSTRDE